jgi:hypothetical protein
VVFRLLGGETGLDHLWDYPSQAATPALAAAALAAATAAFAQAATAATTTLAFAAAAAAVAQPAASATPTVTLAATAATTSAVAGPTAAGLCLSDERRLVHSQLQPLLHTARIGIRLRHPICWTRHGVAAAAAVMGGVTPISAGRTERRLEHVKVAQECMRTHGHGARW